jgi:hypothetical protein
LQSNGDGTTTLVPAPGTITQSGTPMNSSNLNKIETGIKDAHDKIEDYQMYKSVKDSNGVFTTIDYKRTDGTLYAKSVLTGGTSPYYTTRTVTYYATNGTTTLRTEEWTISYDADGDVLNEVKA